MGAPNNQYAAEQPTPSSRALPPATSRGFFAHVLRLARSNSARALLIGSAAIFWWLGCESARRLGRYSPPSVAMPKPSQTVVNNNNAAALLLPVNLEGIAVVYPEQVDALVGSDGRFRTALSLDEIARALSIDPQSIARAGSKNEIDPDAVLFKVVTGRLSNRAKARSRRLRETEYEVIQPALSEPDDWVTAEVPVSLNMLSHPDYSHQQILEAISRSARGLIRQPGAKLNAVPLLRAVRHAETIVFAGGYLPLEPLPDDRAMAEIPAPE
jgi:hypothetical protein